MIIIMGNVVHHLGSGVCLKYTGGALLAIFEMVRRDEE